VRFIVLLRSHVLDHEFHMLTIIDSSQSNIFLSQYFKKKYILFNMSLFKYFKNVLAIMIKFLTS
jgi:hypothetical protein